MFPVRTYSFAPTTARFYRVVMKPHAPSRFGAALGVPPSKGITISELELSGAPRVNRWQEKAQYGISSTSTARRSPRRRPTPRSPSPTSSISPRHAPDGTLDWTRARRPVGGASPRLLAAGTKNHPASPEATGYEVDKLNRLHVTSYIDRYTSQIRSALGPALRQELPLPAARQLRSGDGELDGRHDRPVPRAPRLRSDALSPRAHRTRRRQCGGERQVPLGLPPDDRRSLRRQPLRHDRRRAAQAGARIVRRGDGRRLPDAR